jgi:hypothetical protein
LRADDPDLRLFEIMVIEAAGPQEGAVRRAVETFNGNARTIFAI